jgi:hypothetical protein
MKKLATTSLFIVLTVAALAAQITPQQRDAFRIVRDYLTGVLNTIPVPVGGDLQAALNAAEPGQIIELEVGTYTGNFTLPAKAGVVSLDCSGATLLSPNSQPVLQVGSNWHVMGDAESFCTTRLSAPGDHIRVGTMTQTSWPDNVTFSYVHTAGDPTVGDIRGWSAHGSNIVIVHSRCTEMKAVGKDTQCFFATNGPGPYTLAYNYFEGAGENVMFGGADPSISGMLPADILIFENQFVKPLALKGSSFTVKNILEFKVGKRGRVIGNRFEHIWPAAQTGYAIVAKSTNQDGTQTWAETSELEFAFNDFVNVSAAFNLAGKPEAHPAVRMSNVSVHHNRITTSSEMGGTGRCALIQGVAGVRFYNNDCYTHGAQALYITEAGKNPGLELTGNILVDLSTGIKGDNQTEGTVTLDYYAAGYVFKQNLIQSPQPSLYAPLDNTIVSVLPADTTGYGSGRQ